MSTITHAHTPLGPATSALDDLSLARLPTYLSEEARRALREPRRNLLLAAVSAGQLLRVGDLNRAARGGLDRWITSLDPETLDVLGGVGEQLLAEASARVGAFLAATPEARDLVEASGPEVDPEPGREESASPAEIKAPKGWLTPCILQREQVESLIFVLGRAALRGEDEDFAESAAQAERQLLLQARSLDGTLQALMPLLGDHVDARLLDDPWIQRASLLQIDLPWMALLALRRRGTQAQAAPGVQRPSSATGQAMVLRLPKPTNTRPLALAAHGQDAPPVSAKGLQRRVVGPLRIELSRPDSEEASGEFTIKLALEDSSTLNLSGDAVKLLDDQGQVCEPVGRGNKLPRRWWGCYRGEGRFSLVVEGVSESVPVILIERES